MKSSLEYLKKLFKRHRSIVVLDDFFPNVATAFRVAEYNWYLNCFPQLEIYSTNSDFKAVHAAYAQLYPQYADRVKPFDESSLDGCTLAYMNFLNNAYHFLPVLSSHNIPFLMTLYPGGGFGLGEQESDAKLERVIESPLLRGIIATQNVTIDYLKDKKCKVPVYDIYGAALNPIYFNSNIENRRTSIISGNLSICFVADRYMPGGVNKGYPQFIEAAKLLIRKFPYLRFTVVGRFDSEDYPLDDLIKESISFKGLLFTDELKKFFLTQDIIISPNRPFLLTPGNFDGFPTACCMEASLCGVVVICSDELNLNRYYTNGKDIIICDPVPEAIAEKVEELICNTDLLRSIGYHGQRVSQQIFEPKRQIGRRADLLGKYAFKSSMSNLMQRFKII